MSWHWLRARRFVDKIRWLVILTCAAAIAAVSIALAVVNHRSLRHATFSALRAQTDIAALNSGAPLVFGDRDTATEVLMAFRAMPSVESATLFTADGRAFATYRRGPDGEARQDGAPALGMFETGSRVVSVTNVEDQGQVLGRLRVTYDLSGLDSQLWRNIRLSALVSLIALVLASLLARLLTRVVSRPLAELSRTAQRVSESRDYTVRAALPPRDDEIGDFTRVFNEMLAQIERQDRDLKASREHAEKANRLKDEFLATLSHELRTPMTPILGWAQILGRIEGADERVRQAADIIERNAVAQTRIIDDLLDMSRIIAGKIRLEMQPVSLGDVVEGAVAAVRDAAVARDIALEIDLPVPPPLLRADPHRLQQVLWNLLSNAIKFTPRGGHVDVCARATGDTLQIDVRDTGQGIPPDFLPHVFERFSQADSSVTRTHEGLGLGLAIVKQLVELHGGEVSVFSAGRGCGATFTVALPLRLRDAVAPAHIPAAGATGQGTGRPSPGKPLRDLRLLVVDNDGDARQWLQMVLVDHGAQVAAAASAEEALAMLQRARPDVVISDIGMPEIDGYAFLRMVRALPAEQGGSTPAIAVTAFARGEDRDRALAAGFRQHLGKPVDEQALVAAVLDAAPAQVRP